MMRDKSKGNADYRITTDGTWYRIERRRRRWLGLFGPLVWRGLIGGVRYFTHPQASGALRDMLRQCEGWKDAGEWTYPEKPPPPPPPPAPPRCENPGRGVKA